MASFPDLAAEQAYLDRSYDRLEAMRQAAIDLRDSVIDAGPGGTHQARTERDVFVRTGLQRLEQLQLGRSALCFGRIDTESAETFYIGRLAVSDEVQEPLIVDWRAPVAEAFYRATGRHPMDTIRRRHFATQGRTLLGIEDEVFRADPVAGTQGGDDLEMVGPGALLAALQRSRSGHMRDIVATVQREQDEIIRAELPGLLVVQGGPGTGKTAVALHRAAYLLYTHRFPLERQGVLVIGPNQVFLRYIERVLPSLGESGVILTTLAGLVSDVRAGGFETVEVERLKGDVRMARVVAHAIEDRQRGLAADLEVGFGSHVLRVRAGTTAAIVAAVKRRAGTHNSRRRQVEALMFKALFEAYSTGGEDELDPAEFARVVRRDAVVAAALDRMWPVLSAAELLHDLFGAPTLVALAARRALTSEERALLLRPRSPSLEELRWTAADLPLLDEARSLLGLRRRRSREREREVDSDDEVRAYGHIVVDEAQDLSPMALRMLARRSISGSMTLVGDIGQATSAVAPSGWDEILAHLPSRRGARMTRLTVNYRTPAEIMAVAIEVLAGADLRGVEPPRSVRSTGHLPLIGHAQAGEVAALVAAIVTDSHAAVDGGTVAVIAPVAQLSVLGKALTAAGLPWGEPDRVGLSAPITLLGLSAAKGLEFDAAVVVEPSDLVTESPQGLRALFVALTRTTRRLAIVHSDALPVPLVRGLEVARSTLSEGPA